MDTKEKIFRTGAYADFSEGGGVKIFLLTPCHSRDLQDSKGFKTFKTFKGFKGFNALDYHGLLDLLAKLNGGNAGVPWNMRINRACTCPMPVNKSGHPESNQGPSDFCNNLQSDALPTEL